MTAGTELAVLTKHPFRLCIRHLDIREYTDARIDQARPAWVSGPTLQAAITEVLRYYCSEHGTIVFDMPPISPAIRTKTNSELMKLHPFRRLKFNVNYHLYFIDLLILSNTLHPLRQVLRRLPQCRREFCHHLGDRLDCGNALDTLAGLKDISVVHPL